MAHGAFHRLLRVSVAFAVLVASLVYSIALLPSMASATFSGGNGRIVFTTPGAYGDQILTVKPDGTALRWLTHGPHLNRWPRYSPDGRRILYDHDYEIWIMDVDGSHKRAVVKDVPGKRTGGWTPDWSPSGRAFVFASQRIVTVDPLDSEPDLFIKRLGHPGLRRLTRDPYYERNPLWSPAGGQIAYTRESDSGTFDIWSVRPDGTHHRNLTNSAEDEFLFDFSPSGARILFGRLHATADTATWQLWEMRSDGTNQRMLAGAIADDGDPHADYAPDGTRILVSQVAGCFPDGFCLLARNGDILGGIGVQPGWYGSSWQARSR
jgi:Tol biopolymer transport system component